MIFSEHDLLSRVFYLFRSFSKFTLNRSSVLQTPHDCEMDAHFVVDLEL